VKKDSLIFDRRLETVIEGLPMEYFNLLNKIPKEDAMKVMDYVISLRTEINPSDNYRKSVIKIVTKFIIFCRLSTDKPLKQLVRKDVLAFLDSLRKSEIVDPLHKWIGTYNLYRITWVRII
jgi:hypothetical protein